LKQISRSEIALPYVVVAEVLRGRGEFALKASASQAPWAHQPLSRIKFFVHKKLYPRIQTQKLLSQFEVVVFDKKCAEILESLQQKHKAHKRYADMIAAMAKASNLMVVVSR
jgi:predicted nucleic acid-binding protein